MRHISLRVLCEGLTEARFVDLVLKPHLALHQVYARAEPLCRGQHGIIAYDRLRRAIQADVGRSRDHEYVTTMIDLYQLGKYPGVDPMPSESPLERVKRIEAQMAEGLPNPRFIPYVQLHEFEALLLVDVLRIPEQFPGGEADGAPALLLHDIAGLEPEDVDDGESTSPSKRIIRRAPAYAHVKAFAGPALAKSIGLERLRARCPHFNDWVCRLELPSGRV